MSASSRPQRRSRSRRLDRTRAPGRASNGARPNTGRRAPASAPIELADAEELTTRELLLGGPHTRLDWARAALAGVEAILAPWLLVLLPALLAYVTTADAPALGEAGWRAAVCMGSAVYLMGAGGGLHLGTTEVTSAVLGLAPLGLTVLMLLSVRFAARRQGISDLPTAGVMVTTIALGHLAISFLPAQPAGRVRLLIGSVLIAVLGVVWATPTLILRDRWPRRVRCVLAEVRRAWTALGVVSLVLLAATAVLGRDEIANLYGAVTNDWLGVVLLTLVQLLYLPVFLIWAVSFAAGPGFMVGTGTSFTSTSVVSAPLPALPVLGGLPHPGDPGYGWLVVLPVLIGILAGLGIHRRFRPRKAVESALMASAAGVGIALLGILFAYIASGPVGPGRLQDVGVDPVRLGLALLLEIALPALLVAVLAHPQVKAKLLGKGGKKTNTEDGADTADDEGTADGEDTADAAATADDAVDGEDDFAATDAPAEENQDDTGTADDDADSDDVHPEAEYDAAENVETGEGTRGTGDETGK